MRATGWAARTHHTSVVMPDGSIVLMGGTGDNFVGDTNDMWRSTDNGATWRQVSENSEWAARGSHTSVVIPDGSIILMGGSDGILPNFNTYGGCLAVRFIGTAHLMRLVPLTRRMHPVTVFLVLVTWSIPSGKPGMCYR